MSQPDGLDRLSYFLKNIKYLIQYPRSEKTQRTTPAGILDIICQTDVAGGPEQETVTCRTIDIT